MEKLEKAVSKKLPSVILYMNDLIGIAELLEKENNDVEITLTSKTDEYKFNSADDLNNFKDIEIKKFMISILMVGKIYIAKDSIIG